MAEIDDLRKENKRLLNFETNQRVLNVALKKDIAAAKNAQTTSSERLALAEAKLDETSVEEPELPPVGEDPDDDDPIIDVPPVEPSPDPAPQPSPTGKCLPGLGQGLAHLGAYQKHVGRQPLALAGWHNHACRASFSAIAKLTNTEAGAPNFWGGVKKLKNSAHHILMVPFMPEPMSNRKAANPLVWQRVKPGGIMDAEWRGCWDEFGFRQCAELDRSGCSPENVTDVLGHEMCQESYPWVVTGPEMPSYREAVKVAVDSIRKGGNRFRKGDGDKLHFESRLAGSYRNGTTLEGCLVGRDYIDRVGLSLHENLTGNGVGWADDDAWEDEYEGRGINVGILKVLEHCDKHDILAAADEWDVAVNADHRLNRVASKDPVAAMKRMMGVFEKHGDRFAYHCYLQGEQKLFGGNGMKITPQFSKLCADAHA